MKGLGSGWRPVGPTPSHERNLDLSPHDNLFFVTDVRFARRDW